MKRNVIIHYHLFKNAGTAVDKILHKTFGKNWIKVEGEGPRGRVSSEDLSELLQCNNSIQAISSHQALLPMPESIDYNAIPILLIRHPIDRVRSVYQFERKQRRGTPGAEYASSHNFREYVSWRLAQSSNGVIHNFQCRFLLRRTESLNPSVDASTYPAILDVLETLPFFGLVEQFDRSMHLFNKNFDNALRFRKGSIKRLNVTQIKNSSLEERIISVRNELGGVLFEELLNRNNFDIKLYDDAEKYFEKRIRESSFGN
jgi:hypothetical protein